MTDWSQFKPADPTSGPTDWSQFKPYDPSAKPQGPGALGHVGDTVGAFARGAVVGVKMLSDVFGAGNEVSQTLQKGVEWLGNAQSDLSKWEQLESAREMEAAELSGSTWEEIKAAARAFGRRPVDFLSEAAGTSLPTIVAAFLPGGQGALVARIAAPLIGAAQGAGTVKSSIYEDVERAWVQSGASKEEAKERAEAAQEYLGSNAGQIALGAALGAWAGKQGVEGGLLARRATGEAGEAIAGDAAERGIFGALADKTPRFIREGLKEAVPEAFQGGQEKLAGNLALQNEGFDVATFRGVAGNATLEGLAGGMFGAAASPFTGGEPALDPAVPPGATPAATPAAQASASDQGLADLTKAATTDEAVDAAMRAVDVPLVSEDSLGRLMDAGEADLKGIATSVKFGYAGREPTPTTPEAEARREEQAAMRAMASVDEGAAPMEFSDRVETLRERLADPAIQEGLSQTGMLEKVTEYAAIADRPDLPIPDATRIQLLTMAESLVDRAAPQPAPVTQPMAPTAIQDGDLTTADGYPYGTQASAQARATRDGGEVVAVPGGFVVRPTEVPSANGNAGPSGPGAAQLGAVGDGLGGPTGGGDLGVGGLEGQLDVGGGRPVPSGMPGPGAQPGPVQGPALADGSVGTAALSDDPLAERAQQVITQTGQATASVLQRELGIGYNRAQRILEDFEGAGLVSPMDNKGVRQVLQPRIDTGQVTTRGATGETQTAQPNPTREVVELRKRESVLRQLLACVSA